MLVYGDIETIETVGAKRRAILDRLAETRSMATGIERHGALVAAFISTSELVQGLVDAEFHERGFDTLSESHRDGMECLSILARAIAQSWKSGFEAAPLPQAFFDRLLAFDPSLTIRTRQAEGYAFYALYPESYLEAAGRSGLGPGTQVVGIRSIGTGLGALIAAALGAPPPITLRPVGHPFGREIRVDPALTDQLTADRDRTFAIVDEGPGLSGSSFGSVADWLEEAGIPRERIHFFPSHAGALGPQASHAHRERWNAAPRHLVTMDELLLDPASPHRLATWVEEVTGPLEGPPEDISGGIWRARRYPDETAWPPSNIQQERRKFLVRAQGQSWLVKFAGLGETGLKKLRQARQLHEAGFASQVAGYRHGFLIERWHEDMGSLDQAVIDRGRLLERIGAYLAFRARQFPAEGHQGASLSELRRMALANARQALGEDAAAPLDRFLCVPDDLEGKVRRVCTDNRMHPWEWLVSGERLIKTDALDHAVAHDLIGHQDISWDIAGAIVELNLSEQEAVDLCALVHRRSGHPVHRELLSFMLSCYPAFQIGAHLMAAKALGDGEETIRLRQAAERYGRLLQNRKSLPFAPGL